MSPGGEEIRITVVVRRPDGAPPVDSSRWGEAVLRGLQAELRRGSGPILPPIGATERRQDAVAWFCLALGLLCLLASGVCFFLSRP